MRCSGVLRALLLSAAVGLSVAALPAAAGATVVQSCGNFQSFGTLTEERGFVLNYELFANDGGYAATIRWGDGSQDQVFVSSGDHPSYDPLALSHTYGTPGTYDVTIQTDGSFGDGTDCYDLSPVSIGRVVIKSPPPPAPVSCGSFAPIGQVALEAGDGFYYTFASNDATLDTALVEWGDGSRDSLARPLAPHSTLNSPTHDYNTPGVYDVYLTVTGHFPDGAPCKDYVYLGRVTVSSTPVTQQSVPSTNPCHTCLKPPTITVAKKKCDTFLKKATGQLGKIIRRGTNRRTTCATAQGTNRTCTTTVVYKPCGCRYTITTRVPASGTPHVVKVKKKKLHSAGGRRKH